MKSIRQGRLGNALAWALKAQDGAFATFIADKFLKYYAKNGELQCPDLLENLGSCMLISDRLTFLGLFIFTCIKFICLRYIFFSSNCLHFFSRRFRKVL